MTRVRVMPEHWPALERAMNALEAGEQPRGMDGRVLRYYVAKARRASGQEIGGIIDILDPFGMRELLMPSFGSFLLWFGGAAVAGAALVWIVMEAFTPTTGPGRVVGRIAGRTVEKHAPRLVKKAGDKLLSA